ncbi:MAG: NAD-binding protein [Anaerolineae bacterium]|nr:NAD-binding protein [Anaerolineae bacterium]
MTITTRDDARAAYHRRAIRRRLRASLRDTWVLLREFRVGLVIFTVALLLGAISFQALWNQTYPDNSMRFIEALFQTSALTLMQPTLDFPQEWYLDIYYFLMPLLGVIALATGLADFLPLLFNRRSRHSQWEAAVASTFNDHIIIIGLGHLGIRVVRELVILDEDIVVIEIHEDSPRFVEVREYDIPVITGDARNVDILDAAGIDRAAAVIIATNNDLANLQIASRIRETNRSIRIVMRMFDDQFAEAMADRFEVSAVMSASMMAAPAFAGAAAGTEIVQTFKVGDQVLAMGRVEVQPCSRLDGAAVGSVEDTLDISIVLLQSGDAVDQSPNDDVVLHSGDVIAVVAGLPQIKDLARNWNRPCRDEQ